MYIFTPVSISATNVPISDYLADLAKIYNYITHSFIEVYKHR
jgi:hypothetical protein